MAKKNYEEVAEYFKENGCVLLEKEYVSKATKMRYVCSCGNQGSTSFSSFVKGVRCKKCAVSKRTITRRHSIEDLKKVFEAEGCMLLSDSYDGCAHKLSFVAKCGHEHETFLNKFRSGGNRYCPNCLNKYKNHGRKLTVDFVKSFFNEQNCTLLEKTYKNNSTDMKYRCECGNVSYITFASFKRGSRCQKCKSRKIGEKSRKYTLTEVEKIFNDRGFTLLEEKYFSTKHKMRYICSCGNMHKTNLDSILYRDSKCPECKRRALSGENHYNWKPELTDEEREKNKSRLNDPEISKWRREVFKRDNHTCQCCNIRGNGTLNAHHLDGYHWCIEKRTDIDNGVTLCEECHREFHDLYGKGHNTREQYKEWIRNKRKQGA